MTTTQIPRGPDHLYCPQWRKKMSTVCHTCPWWQQVRGAHPQDATQSVDRWDCAIALLPLLTIEAAKQQRSTAAAVETLTTATTQNNAGANAMAQAVLSVMNRAVEAQPAMIEMACAPSHKQLAG